MEPRAFVGDVAAQSCAVSGRHRRPDVVGVGQREGGHRSDDHRRAAVRVLVRSRVSHLQEPSERRRAERSRPHDPGRPALGDDARVGRDRSLCVPVARRDREPADAARHPALGGHARRRDGLLRRRRAEASSGARVGERADPRRGRASHRDGLAARSTRVDSLGELGRKAHRSGAGRAQGATGFGARLPGLRRDGAARRQAGGRVSLLQHADPGAARRARAGARGAAGVGRACRLREAGDRSLAAARREPHQHDARRARHSDDALVAAGGGDRRGARAVRHDRARRLRVPLPVPDVDDPGALPGAARAAHRSSGAAASHARLRRQTPGAPWRSVHVPQLRGAASRCERQGGRALCVLLGRQRPRPRSSARGEAGDRAGARARRGAGPAEERAHAVDGVDGGRGRAAARGRRLTGDGPRRVGPRRRRSPEGQAHARRAAARREAPAAEEEVIFD